MNVSRSMGKKGALLHEAKYATSFPDDLVLTTAYDRLDMSALTSMKRA
jgi:hypothetical protein